MRALFLTNTGFNGFEQGIVDGDISNRLHEGLFSEQ